MSLTRRWLSVLFVLVASFSAIFFQGRYVSAGTFEGFDDDGKAYSIVINGTGDAGVGETVTLTISASHEDGIRRVIFVEDDDYLNQTIEHCDCSLNCEFSVDITQDYEGGKLLEVILWKCPNDYSASALDTINFFCPIEYCSPDPLFNDFVEWMRTRDYAECITSQYVEWSLDTRQKCIMRDFLEERPSGISQPLVVEFYDVIPTDAQATSYRSLGAGEGGDCQDNPNWPEFCPVPVPADYLFLENHFRRTFGMDITFVYIPYPISYADTFGEPTLIDDSYYRFGSRYEFIQDFPDHAIIHYALETWNDLFVGDMSGGSHVCEVSLEPYYSLGAVTYTHEWGHTWGLTHPFYFNENNQRILIQFDGIMSNTYYGSSSLIDPLDPMERYALEPLGGYLDAATFATDYSNGIIDSWLTGTCGFVDPAIVGAEAVAETSDAVTFGLELSNLGDLLAGYVDLAAYDGISMEALIEERTLWTLPSGDPIMHEFTIEKDSLTSGVLVFAIDAEDEIVDNEENNRIVLVEDQGWHVLGIPGITYLVDLWEYIKVYWHSGGDYVHHYKIQWSLDSEFNTLTGEISCYDPERGWVNVMHYMLDGICKTYYFRIAACGPDEACGLWSQTASIVYGLKQCPSPDSDEDGIMDLIDTAPGVYSNDFADASSTDGSIIDRGDQELLITDVPNPTGVRIAADHEGEATPATVAVCGGSATYTLDASDQIITTCGSVEIEVLNGTVEIQFVASDGTPATTSLEADNALTFDPDTFTITAASTNSGDAVVLVNGEEFHVAPGESVELNGGGVEGIVIDGCDTGVVDQVYDGQYISEWIDGCAATAKNHGTFVSCVSKLTNGLKKAGLITGKEKGAIQSCAAQADVP